MSGTEDSILDSIPDFQSDSSPGIGHNSGETGGGSGDAQTSAQPTQHEGGTTSAQPTQGGGDSGTAQQPAGAVRRRHDGLVEVPNQENPNTRDLVDPISGRTVARGGIERKIFEDGQRATRENNSLKQQLANATRALGSINEVTQEAVRLNIAPEDQKIAIRVMADFMRDPVRTLQSLVEEVKSKGYQIPFLTEGVSPGMDLAAIQRMIDAKMAPITETQMQQRRAREAEAAGRTQLNEFIENNPEANENLDVLAEMLQAQPTLSLGDAYTKMIRWAHENGLDWTQGLKTQIAGRQSQQPTHQQPTQQPTQRSPRQMPGGRSAGGGAQPLQGNGAVQQHNENASWSEIIRHAMQEHGVQLN